jgi:hypothetical protein
VNYGASSGALLVVLAALSIVQPSSPIAQSRMTPPMRRELLELLKIHR